MVKRASQKSEGNAAVPSQSPAVSRSPYDEGLWRARADAYACDYKGPVHFQRLLNTLAATGSLPLALREAALTRYAYNQRRERYPEFAEAIDEAHQFYRHGVLEAAASSRAVDGWLEPVFHKGVIVGHVRRFSDTLLVKLMEGNIPEKYRPKTDVNFSGKIQVEGGLPPRPFTEADVPPEIREALTIDNPPQSPQIEPPSPTTSE